MQQRASTLYLPSLTTSIRHILSTWSLIWKRVSIITKAIWKVQITPFELTQKQPETFTRWRQHNVHTKGSGRSCFPQMQVLGGGEGRNHSCTKKWTEQLFLTRTSNDDSNRGTEKSYASLLQIDVSMLPTHSLRSCMVSSDLYVESCTDNSPCSHKRS